MGREVKKYPDITGDGRFLFFKESLHIGNTVFEPHASILASSGRNRDQIMVAGVYNACFPDMVIIDGSGSTGLEIKARDAMPVQTFVENLPDRGEGIVKICQ